MRQAPVAQLVERLICNQRVAGSMPARGSSNRVPWGYEHPARPARSGRVHSAAAQGKRRDTPRAT